MRLPEELAKAFSDLRDQTYSVCSSVGFADVCHLLKMQEQYILADPTIARLYAELDHLQQSILKELGSRIYLAVRTDRQEYAGSTNPFGERVSLAFPSTVADIEQAANCLAAECNTAAVFHLTRVAEMGLRALALDRRVTISKKNRKPLPLDLATWEDIIRKLEKAEADIQNFPAGHAREAQFSFYHESMLEVRRFKNIWRNQIMHSRG